MASDDAGKTRSDDFAKAKVMRCVPINAQSAHHFRWIHHLGVAQTSRSALAEHIVCKHRGRFYALYGTLLKIIPQTLSPLSR